MYVFEYMYIKIMCSHSLFAVNIPMLTKSPQNRVTFPCDFKAFFHHVTCLGSWKPSGNPSENAHWQSEIVPGSSLVVEDFSLAQSYQKKIAPCHLLWMKTAKLDQQTCSSYMFNMCFCVFSTWVFDLFGE